MITRYLTDAIQKRLFKGKAILLTGPRQVGKTTLIKMLLEQVNQPFLWYNADEIDVREKFNHPTSDQLRKEFGTTKLVVIDEAQRIKNIGITLKIMIDMLPDVQLIVTGSSALELADEINEPLTGRKYDFNLFGLSHSEMSSFTSATEEKRLLERRLLYGFYPQVITNTGEEIEILQQLSTSYLYKDLLSLKDIRKPHLLEKLIKALALQIGGEVSYNELAQLIEADKETVEKYIDLLEKTYIIFKLSAFSRNQRNELKRTRKIYFWDNGIRNGILNDFKTIALRSDIGALWENFWISERMKRNKYSLYYCNSYFWRTPQQQEIDYIEERDEMLYAFECKWNVKSKAQIPKTFMQAYPNHESFIVTPQNYVDFLEL